MTSCSFLQAHSQEGEVHELGSTAEVQRENWKEWLKNTGPRQGQGCSSLSVWHLESDRATGI